MSSWTDGMVMNRMFLGTGASGMGGVGGGPANPGVSKTQPVNTRNGNLLANYSCGGGCGCGCGNPMPPSNGSDGVDDAYLCLNMQPETK